MPKGRCSLCAVDTFSVHAILGLVACNADLICIMPIDKYLWRGKFVIGKFDVYQRWVLTWLAASLLSEYLTQTNENYVSLSHFYHSKCVS